METENRRHTMYTICIFTNKKYSFAVQPTVTLTEKTQQIIMDEHKLFPLDAKQHTKAEPKKKKYENMNKKKSMQLMLDGDDDLMLTRILLVLTCIRAEPRAQS